MQSSVRVVIIGGGITGCSIAYHLAKAGWKDIVLLEKGELTSGTTFHSVGLVSQFRHSSSLMQLQNYSIALYNELYAQVGDGLGWHQVGSLRLASSADQLKNLKRQASRAKALGLNVEIISPSEAKKIFPPLTLDNLYGAVHIPDDGWLEPNGITQELARRARALGAAVHTNVRVTGIELSAQRAVTAVQTTHGTIKTEIVVNAAGQWASRIGEMVGVILPMTPIMHQFLTTKPIPGHALPRSTPVVRDPDNLVYIREDIGGYLIGGFEANPKAWSVEGVPWEFTQKLLAPEWELFEPLMQGALRRVPILEKAEVTNLINGPEAITPDGAYVLGPVPGLRGFWVAAGMSLNGIAGAGGTGRLMAEWIVDGEPSIDVAEMNVRRFGPHFADKNFCAARAREVYKYYYLLRYPNDENEWGRPMRVSPLVPRLQALGAVFGEKNGWERVNYFEAGKPSHRAGAEYRTFDRPSYFELVGEEHRAAREHVALFDMTSFNKIDVHGPGAFALLQRLADNDIAKPLGSLTYTQFLNEKGGIESDLTITRLGADDFRVTTGTAFGAQDMGWLTMHEPRDGSVEIKDVTMDYACLGLWGPYARKLLEQVTTQDVSNAKFPYMTACMIDVAGARVLAQRVSYVGELGWELYIANADAIKVWDVLMEAGKPLGIRPAGYKALETLRLEKSYRYWSADITPAENPLESGQGFCVKLNKGDFIGRDALIKLKERGLTRKLCPLTIDPNCVVNGGEAVYADGNPVPHATPADARMRVAQGKVVGRVRSGGYGYTLGTNIGYTYLPLDLAKVGTTLRVDVLGEYVSAQVAPDPLFDPIGVRLKA
jgi:glycine cleavage system aminomethyltransferase T/glycine/D-amino acid oxidase-like deaminating enzyme